VLLELLLQQGRATRLELESGEVLWVAAPALSQVARGLPESPSPPELVLPAALAASVAPEAAWRELVRARLESPRARQRACLGAALAQPGSDAAPSPG
jgi:hypothetical protein